ncbi:MAG: tetratricopeptide repeat protein, partial [Pirellulales bacterium]
MGAETVVVARDGEAGSSGRSWRRQRRVRARLLAAFAVAIGCAVIFPLWRHLRLAAGLAAARDLLRTSQVDEAVGSLERMIARWPECGEAEYLLAIACRRSLRLDLALPHLERAAELGWDAKDIDRQRYLTYFQCGDYRRSSKEVLDLLLEDATDDDAEDTYEAVARGYMAGLRLTEAQFMLAKWLEWRPGEARAYLLRAEIAMLDDDHESEIAAYRDLLRFQPRHYEARRRLGEALTKKYADKEALQLLSECVRERPHDVDALLALATWYHRTAQVEQAKKIGRAVLAERPAGRRLAQACSLLGQLAIEAKDYDEAVRNLRLAVEADPGSIAALYALSQSLSRAGHAEEAKVSKERCERVEALDQRLFGLREDILRDPGDPDTRFEIGTILLEQGDTKSGVNWLLSVLFHDPSHVAAHRALAEYYEKIDESATAALHRAKAEQGGANPPMLVPTSTPQAVRPPGTFREVFLPHATDLESYIGSAECADCHRAIYNRHSQSRMANCLASARECLRRHELPLPAEVNDEANGYRYRVEADGDELVLRVIRGEESIRVALEYALGSGQRGLTFARDFDADHYQESRVSYYADTNSWDITPGEETARPTSLAEAVGSLIPKRSPAACLSCHASRLVQVDGKIDLDRSHFGVDCERCHGPGLD